MGIVIVALVVGLSICVAIVGKLCNNDFVWDDEVA